MRNFSFRGTPKSQAMPHRPAVRRRLSARLPLGWLHSSRKEAARQDVDRRIVPVVLDAVFQEVQFAPNAGEPDLYPKREAGAACPERIGAKPRGRL